MIFQKFLSFYKSNTHQSTNQPNNGHMDQQTNIPSYLEAMKVKPSFGHICQSIKFHHFFLQKSLTKHNQELATAGDQETWK